MLTQPTIAGHPYPSVRARTDATEEVEEEGKLNGLLRRKRSSPSFAVMTSTYVFRDLSSCQFKLDEAEKKCPNRAAYHGSLWNGKKMDPLEGERGSNFSPARCTERTERPMEMKFNGLTDYAAILSKSIQFLTPKPKLQ